MRISKNIVFAVAGLLVVALVTAVAVRIKSLPRTIRGGEMRPTSRPGTAVITNLRQLDMTDPEIREFSETMDQSRARIRALVPEGTHFSNAVAVLGSDFETIPAAGLVRFRFKFPGATDQSYIVFAVKSNVVAQIEPESKLGWEQIKQWHDSHPH